MLPNAGTYRARLNGPVVVNEAQTGALCAYLPVIIPGEDWQWTGKHTMTLIKKDGTPQTRTIDTLKKVFGWDGTDPFWLADQQFEGVEFDIVGVHDKYTPEGSDEEKTVFKIQWLNPVGEAGGFQMPEQGDRKSILAKYGSKFRALSGGSKPAVAPAKAAAATQAAAPKAKASGTTSTSKSPGPPSGPPKKAPLKTASGQARTSTMEEAWGRLQEVRPDVTAEDELATIWYAMIEELFGEGKTNSDLTIQDWGKVMDHLDAQAPAPE